MTEFNMQKPTATDKPIMITVKSPVRAGAKKIVEITKLSKKYSAKADFAVKDLEMVCYEGEIVGLLGHNGAGKSTTLKCLTGMLPFSEGEILIDGKSIKADPVGTKQCFGFVTDNHSVFVKMTGAQYLNFMADVYGVPEAERKGRIDELEACFQLGDKLFNLINSYSHGMKQKICMMGSLIHKPRLWILDEPMVGLDPRTARAVSDFMKQYVKAGNTILFSSHNLDAVQRLCDRAVIIKKGVKVADIVISTFLKNNPGLDLEEFFLSDSVN